MLVCKCMIFMLFTLIHLNNAQLSLDAIKNNITLTVKIITLDLESTKNDILTTVNALESRVNMDDITKLVNDLQPKLQQILPTNQLAAFDTSDTAILGALFSINGIRLVLSNTLVLLKEIINDLTNAIANLDSISSTSSNDLVATAYNLQSALQDALIQLNTFSDLVFSNMTFYIQSYTTGFNIAMNGAQEALSTKLSSTTTQSDQNQMANQIDVLTSLLTIQKSFNDLVNSINQEIFKYISTVADANSGILTPLLSTLSGVLYQVTTCGNSSYDNVVPYPTYPIVYNSLNTNNSSM